MQWFGPLMQSSDNTYCCYRIRMYCKDLYSVVFCYSIAFFFVSFVRFYDQRPKDEKRKNCGDGFVWHWLLDHLDHHPLDFLEKSVLRLFVPNKLWMAYYCCLLLLKIHYCLIKHDNTMNSFLTKLPMPKYRVTQQVLDSGHKKVVK